MALVTAQKRQALRLPTPDLSVDSIDQLALLGLFQIETTAPTLATNTKRQVLRLPTVDASVDSDDAYGFLQLPQSAGTGPTVDVFSLSWTIDPTFSISEDDGTIDGAVGFTLRQFGLSFPGTVLDAVDNPVISLGFEIGVRRTDVLLSTKIIDAPPSHRSISVSLSTRKIAQIFKTRKISADLNTRRVVVA